MVAAGGGVTEVIGELVAVVAKDRRTNSVASTELASAVLRTRVAIVTGDPIVRREHTLAVLALPTDTLVAGVAPFV
jgi:hypothetical protein